MGNNLKPIIAQINGHTWRQVLCNTTHRGCYCTGGKLLHCVWKQLGMCCQDTTLPKTSVWLYWFWNRKTEEGADGHCAVTELLASHRQTHRKTHTSVHAGSAPRRTSQKDGREEQVLVSTCILRAQCDEFTSHYTTVASAHWLQIETAHIIRYT